MSNDTAILTGIGLFAVSLALTLYAVLRGRRSGHEAVDGDDLIGQATEGSDFLTQRVLSSVARPMVGSRRLHELAGTEELSWLQRLLLAAGSPYGGSVEVFLAFQVAAIIVGLSVAILGALLTSVFPVWLVASLGAAIMFLPFSRLYDQARKRSARIIADLPDFVDLLMIPIVAGTGIRRSLRETAERFYGPVRTEVLNAISMVEVGKPLSEALWYAGHRLAVPEAKVFFAAIAQAEQQGISVREMLEKQRDALRHESHQRARAEIKKIPTRIVLVFGIHFMPVLFAIALVPLISSFSRI